MPKLDTSKLIDEDIFDILGMQKMDEKTKDDLRVKMLESVNNRVLLRISDMLNDEDMKNFEKLLDNNNEKEIQAFLVKKNINILLLVTEEAFIYKKQLVETLNNSKS